MADRIATTTVPPASLALFWFEQSHFALKTPGGAIAHIDPFLSRVVKPEAHIYPEPVMQPGDVRADLVLLTHDHRDHTDPYTIGPLAEANPRCVFVGPAESCDHIRRDCPAIAPERLLPIAIGEDRTVGDFTVHALYSRDTSGKDQTTHLGLIVRAAGVTVYAVGDTHKDVASYESRLAPVRGLRPDAMLVPINRGYDNPGPEGALELISWVEPRLIVPCHYGCFVHNTIDPAEFLAVLPGDVRARVRVMARGGEIFVSRA
jgi:L-ascorbate 6-phosphate lactonase